MNLESREVLGLKQI